MGFLNPYVLLALVLAFLSASAGSFLYGQHVANLSCAVSKDKMIQESQARQQAELGRAIVAATKLEKVKAAAVIQNRIDSQKVETIIATKREVVNGVSQDFYRGQCLEPDGVSELNAIIAGPTAAPSGSRPGLPAAPRP